MKSIFGLRGRRLTIVTVAIFAVAAGIAYAAIPDATGVYHACMLKNIGTIRIIDADKQHCVSALETEITFNQKGQQGIQGLQGIQGTQGVQGIKGSPGPQGDPGTNGQNGTNGSNGAPGVSPTVTQLVAGDPNCPAGGAAITSAAGTTAYVCSGANGHDGQNGADGQPFSGTFTSPNGQYSISVTDTGIAVAHGATQLKIAGDNIMVRSNGDTDLDVGADLNMRAGSRFELESGAGVRVLGDVALSLQGAQVTLNGGSTCPAAAREGDGVFATVSGPTALGSILTGSTSVCIGD